MQITRNFTYFGTSNSVKLILHLMKYHKKSDFKSYFERLRQYGLRSSDNSINVIDTSVVFVCTNVVIRFTKSVSTKTIFYVLKL